MLWSNKITHAYFVQVIEKKKAFNVMEWNQRLKNIFYDNNIGIRLF